MFVILFVVIGLVFFIGIFFVGRCLFVERIYLLSLYVYLI